MIFAKKDKIFEFNYETEEIRDVCIYDENMKRQPEFFRLNDKQDVAIVASKDDGIYCNFKTKKQLDLDDLYQISNICEIIHDEEEGNFYMLVNKHKGMLGLFLIQMDEANPGTMYQFFLKYNSKLNVGDASISIIRNPKKNTKELLVGYKTIFMNTYTVHVINISQADKFTIFQHLDF